MDWAVDDYSRSYADTVSSPDSNNGIYFSNNDNTKEHTDVNNRSQHNRSQHNDKCDMTHKCDTQSKYAPRIHNSSENFSNNSNFCENVSNDIQPLFSINVHYLKLFLLIIIIILLAMILSAINKMSTRVKCMMYAVLNK